MATHFFQQHGEYLNPCPAFKPRPEKTGMYTGDPLHKETLPRREKCCFEKPIFNPFANGKRAARVSISPTMTPQELKYKVYF